MKCVVLLSGGVDSTTCLAMALTKYKKEDVLALTAYYGQKHAKELEAAGGQFVSGFFSERLFAPAGQS